VNVDLTTIATAAIAVVAGAVGAYAALRKDGRDTRAQAIAEAGKTIELLKEQTELLRSQGEVREGEWRRLEQTWHEREARLEKRIEAVEGDYRRLVLTVTNMGLCANAPTCANYNPGDRRARRLPRPDDPETPLPEEGVEG